MPCLHKIKNALGIYEEVAITLNSQYYREERKPRALLQKCVEPNCTKVRAVELKAVRGLARVPLRVMWCIGKILHGFLVLYYSSYS